MSHPKIDIKNYRSFTPIMMKLMNKTASQDVTLILFTRRYTR